MQISDNVHFLEAREKNIFGIHESNVFLVGQDQMAMIDTGGATESAIRAKMDYVAALGGRQVTDILITHHHWDHIGGASSIKAATGAKVKAHALDSSTSESLEAIGPEALEGSHCVEIGQTRVQVVHTPGHTPGHLCFFLPEEGILFSGDLVVGMGTSVVGPPLGNMTDYLDSLGKLSKMDIGLICSGHGALIKEPQRKIRELIEHRFEREAQILALLALNPQTVADIARGIYPEIDSRLLKLASVTILGHLGKLLRDGRATTLDSDGERRYSIT